MNKRLLCIAENIGNGKGFADVGTDHGYLPVHMAQQGYGGNIIASDINIDPLNCARRNAEAAGVEDKLRFILCDGLDESMKSQVDTIIIAGMGGDTICGILDRAEWCMDASYQLILQPMTKAEVLRYWLSYNDFLITKEILIEDGGTIYQIICAQYGKRDELNDAELFVGKRRLSEKNDLYQQHLETNIVRFNKMIKGLSKSQDPQDAARLIFYKGIYSQLCAMRQTDM